MILFRCGLILIWGIGMVLCIMSLFCSCLVMVCIMI